MIFRTKHFSRRTVAVLCLTLLWSIVGCDENTNDVTDRRFDQEEYDIDTNTKLTDAPSPEELIDARMQYELAAIRSQARDVFSLENDGPPNETIEEKAGQWLVQGQFDRATHAALSIENEPVRDSFLEEIVRSHTALTLRRLRDDAPLSVLSENEAKMIEDETIRSVLLTAGSISEPLRRGMVYDNIAVFCTVLKRPDEMTLCLKKAADAFIQVVVDDAIKAKELCRLARRFVSLDMPEEGLRCWREAEIAASQINEPFDAAVAFLDLAETLVLVDKDRSVEKLCDEIAARAEGISEPREKGTVLLKLVSLMLDAGTRKKGISVDLFFQVLKKILHDVDRLIAMHFEEQSSSASTVLPSVSMAEPPKRELHKMMNRSVVLDWNEIKNRRNELLARMAKTQVWAASLEDAWDTILDIEEGPRRDEALLEAVDMLLLSDDGETAEAWADELTDKKAKEAVLLKIKAATKD